MECCRPPGWWHAWNSGKHPTPRPTETSLPLVGGRRGRCYGLCWKNLGFLGSFSQNEEAPQCPHRNYFEEFMQTFDRQEGKKKKKRKDTDLYASIRLYGAL